MKSIPILDDSAREKAEKDRKTLSKKLRASQRAYKGPLLFSDTARQAEKNRKKKLRRDFNKADARWSKVKREANIRGSSELVLLASQLTKPLKVKRLFPSLVCFLNPSPEAPSGIDLKGENMNSVLIKANLTWLCYELFWRESVRINAV